MSGVIELPVWLAILGALALCIAALDRILAPSFRWFFRRRLHRAVNELNKRLQLQIQPFKLMRRQELIDRLVYDPEVTQAAEDYIRDTGMPRDLVIRQIQIYAKEITPSFSALIYFTIGARLAKWVSRFLYRVRLGHVDENALTNIDKDASVVFVMNHRSNVDYILITYLASTSSALSYAVGEWAQIWPLSRLIRAMGAYFIRRKSRDALYRAVLRRYVQLSTVGGVAQAIFPEGGLSRDGYLGPPKLGLLNYIVEGFDPNGPRDVVFIPVGLNYDRVMEDRLLIRAAAAEGKPKFRVSPFGAMGFTLKFVLGRITGRIHRFGYACVSFGAPMSLRKFLTTNPEAPTEALGDELSRCIGAVVPALPTPLIAQVLLDAGQEGLSFADVKANVDKLVSHVESAGGHTHIPRDSFDYAVEFGMKMLTTRYIVVEEAGIYRPAAQESAILQYYAASIAHLTGRKTG
ncbi:MAG: 1-acyl-sn-glycerol-3-phosphate acyltransferase [Pikeienuella sp.]